MSAAPPVVKLDRYTTQIEFILNTVLDMATVSKKQMGIALLFISSALMVVGATLIAYDGPPFEDSGLYLVVVGMIGMALGFAGVLLHRNAQQGAQHADRQ